MALWESITTRLASLLGLDFDFSVSLASEPFNPITPSIVLGSRPRPEQLEVLRELGITHVVSCLPETRRSEVAFLGAELDTFFLPLHDGVGENIRGVLPQFFDFVSGAGPDAKVLVHCEVGVSRSATLVTAHLMKTQRLRFFEAYREVRERRPQVLPNIGFASGLQHYEHTLFPEPREGHASLTRYLHEVCNVPVEIDVLQSVLERHDYDAVRAIRAIFGGEIPRVVQGVRL